jgi:hypothetical protein
MNYLRTQQKKGKKQPQKGHEGETNGNYKHGGHCVDLLNDVERERFEKYKREYLVAYPYLSEPAMADLLRETLILKIRMERINAYILGTPLGFADLHASSKLLDMLERTFSLYLTRLGLTYVSRQRMKKRGKRKTALEMITEGDK